MGTTGYCVDLSVCNPRHDYVSTPATMTSDRVCHRCRRPGSCSSGQFLLGTCSADSPPQCTDCPIGRVCTHRQACASDTISATCPPICPDNTYSNSNNTVRCTPC